MYSSNVSLSRTHEVCLLGALASMQKTLVHPCKNAIQPMHAPMHYVHFKWYASVCVCVCELNSCSVQVLYSLLATRHSNTHTCANLSVGQPQSQSNGNLGSSYSALHMQCTLCTHTISCYVRSSRSTPAKYVHVDASTGVGVCCALHNVPKSETIAGCTYIPMWIVDML